MIKFYNNIENEMFLAIVECLKKVADIDYKGFETDDPFDEMNDFMESIPLLENLNAYCWFDQIYDKWMYNAYSLSAETIKKSFEDALNGKHFYDVDNYLDGWDKDLVEYVLNEKEEFVILNDKYDYEDFLNKYRVIIKCPCSNYQYYRLDLWEKCENVLEKAKELLIDSVSFQENYYINDDDEYEDEDGNIIDIEKEVTWYAESWLENIDFDEVDIEYYSN